MDERCTFFRLQRDQAKALFACRTPQTLKAFFAALDPATPSVEGGATALALHRLLTGSVEPDAGLYPLNHAVLGGRVLGHEPGFAVVLKRPDMSPHIADSLVKIAPETIEATFAQLIVEQPELADDVQSSALATLLVALTALYQSAASAGEAVVLVRTS